MKTQPEKTTSLVSVFNPFFLIGVLAWLVPVSMKFAFRLFAKIPRISLKFFSRLLKSLIRRKQLRASSFLQPARVTSLPTPAVFEGHANLARARSFDLRKM